MLSNSWEHGAIPDSPTAIYRAMGLAPTDQPFETIWGEVSGKWKKTNLGWINVRLERVREEQKAFKAQQASAGRASGKKRRELSRERNMNDRSTSVATEPRTEREPEGQPNVNSQSLSSSPISDLRSPSSPPPPERAEETRALTPARDDEGRVLHEGGAWNRSGRAIQRSELFDGGEARRHGMHAVCGRLCVSLGLHLEFMARLGGEDADARLRAWYPATLARYEGQTIGDDTFDFWRNEFAAWVGTVTTKPARTNSRSGETLDAGKAVLRERLGRIRDEEERSVSERKG